MTNKRLSKRISCDTNLTIKYMYIASMLAVIETIKKIGNKRSIGTKYSRYDREGNFCDKKNQTT